MPNTPTVALHYFLTNPNFFIVFQHRATAMAVGSMFGRLGSVTFAYILGLLLDYHCRVAFVTTFVMFISKRTNGVLITFHFLIFLF